MVEPSPIWRLTLLTLLVSPQDVLALVCFERSCSDWPGWPTAVSIPLVRLLIVNSLSDCFCWSSWGRC